MWLIFMLVLHTGIYIFYMKKFHPDVLSRIRRFAMYVFFFKYSILMISVFLSGLIIFSMVSCSETPGPRKSVTANSNQALLDALDEHTSVVILGNFKGPQVIITPELSARVLGAAIEGYMDENLMWVDSTIMDETYWQKKPYFWNAGGLREYLVAEVALHPTARS